MTDSLPEFDLSETDSQRGIAGDEFEAPDA